MKRWMPPRAILLGIGLICLAATLGITAQAHHMPHWVAHIGAVLTTALAFVTKSPVTFQIHLGRRQEKPPGP